MIVEENWMKLKHENLDDFLSGLREKAKLIIPRKEEGDWKWGIYQESDVVEDFPPSLIDESVKKFFFPKRRPIGEFETDEEWSLSPVDRPEKKRIIMGIHPCDMAGIEYMDQVFLESDTKDELYAAERDRTVLIGMYCDEMEENCHCTDRNINPQTSESMDIVFTTTEDGYLLNSISEEGKEILESVSMYLNKTDDKPEEEEWPEGKYEVAPPEELLNSYNDEIWEEFADICLTCGACTFACPTCTCFLITDEKSDGEGERVTVWDSCQFSSYSKMSSGHNPREMNSDRIRNRTLDKFAYSYERHGKISCTGCGRCVNVCPLDRSFPQIASTISEKIMNSKNSTSKELSKGGINYS